MCIVYGFIHHPICYDENKVVNCINAQYSLGSLHLLYHIQYSFYSYIQRKRFIHMKRGNRPFNSDIEYRSVLNLWSIVRFIGWRSTIKIMSFALYDVFRSNHVRLNLYTMYLYDGAANSKQYNPLSKTIESNSLKESII